MLHNTLLTVVPGDLGAPWYPALLTGLIFRPVLVYSYLFDQGSKSGLDLKSPHAGGTSHYLRACEPESLPRFLKPGLQDRDRLWETKSA